MDRIILTYHDSCLYESDYEILRRSTSWLNDRIISFYYEYLQRNVLESETILFIAPEVTQAIKMWANPAEVNAIFLEPLNPSVHSLIIFAVNNNSTVLAGGSHWSLCAFSRLDNIFYHFDSLSGSNASSCLSLVKILRTCLACPNAKIEEVSCTQQNNSFDCGIFLLCHTDLVCKTFKKSGNLTSIEKLETSKVTGKRAEIIQIIQSIW